jgi:transposase InsO family protein
MPVSRFCQLTGVPRRTYCRWQAKARAGAPPKGPWPAPVVDAVEPLVAKYAADWPAWGHRKVFGLLRADGISVSVSSVERAMRRRGLLQPIDYTGERRELAKARKAAFADPPTAPHQVWQLDFSEYETTTGGTWRLAGCCDYYSKHEYGWHIAGGCTGADAIAAVRLAITEAETLAGGVPLIDQLPVDPDTGQPRRIKLVTDNGGAFKGHAFAAFLATRPEFLHIRTRRKSPGQNGVRERAFGSLKYEHLYRMEIQTLQDLAREAEAYRQVFNHIRPHEALNLHRPIEVHRNPSLKPQPKAAHLARLLRLGEVTPVAVPTLEREMARDLVRAREDARGDLMRARHRLSKLLLRHGIVCSGGAAWTGPHDVWAASPGLGGRRCRTRSCAGASPSDLFALRRNPQAS